MSPCRVKQQEILKTGKFLLPAEMRRSTKQPGLAAAESSKPELRPPEKRDRRSLCGMSTVTAVGADVLKNGQMLEGYIRSGTVARCHSDS